MVLFVAKICANTQDSCTCAFGKRHKRCRYHFQPPKAGCKLSKWKSGLQPKTFEWDIRMKNVYFESYHGCVGKFGLILNVAIASPPIYTYTSYQTQMDWPLYNGSIYHHWRTVLQVITGCLADSNTSKTYYLISPRDGTSFCGSQTC